STRVFRRAMAAGCSSSARTSTPSRRPARSSRCWTTAWFETRRARFSVPTTSPRSRSCSRRRAACSPRTSLTRGSSSCALRGRRDDGTTANAGRTEGGNAGSGVAEWCAFLGSAPSHDEKRLRDVVPEVVGATAFAAGLEDCAVETEVHKSYRGYCFKPEDEV